MAKRTMKILLHAYCKLVGAYILDRGMMSRSYNCYLVHLTDPGHKMKPLSNTAQFLSDFMTVSCLRPIENERSSVMSLAFTILFHVELLVARNMCEVVVVQAKSAFSFLNITGPRTIFTLLTGI
jgi:hypothetical protein